MSSSNPPSPGEAFFRQPILNSPYKEPKLHWELDENGQPTQRIESFRRRAEFVTPIPFFCQVEAMETLIWLTEVAPKLGKQEKGIIEHLANANNDANPELARVALKLATGAGKTTVMAMIIAWQTVNAVRRPQSKNFASGFLVVTPGLTIKDRLRVLQPNDPDSYYASRELVPTDMLGDLGKAKIVITNYHAFKLRETMELSSGGRSTTNLHRRLGLQGPDDELTQLGSTLDDLFGRLEPSFESQRRFVANASHELRTPLAGQRTLLQVALADPDATDESLRAACEEALALGERQERLVDGLLTLASSERGIERREPLDLAQIAERVLVSRQQDAARRGIEIRASLDAAPTTGDPVLIESMIANLLDNAIQHNTPDGSIDLTTSLHGAASQVSVGNTGPSVPTAEVERLFQPFQRLGHNRTRSGDGHGLGLAIVQAIAKAHDVKITAHPRSAGGLDVEVNFPSPQDSITAP